MASEERRGAHSLFADVSTTVARWTGNHWAVVIAAALVALSLAFLGIEITNVAISIVTLLMVFVLQNTQNRDSAALHLKLDEVVRVEPEARDDLRRAEERSHDEIEELHEEIHEGEERGSLTGS
jgi:low affinity Fe/Cu permease